MGPIKDGRVVEASCLLSNSTRVLARDSSSAVQSRSMLAMFSSE